MPRKPENTTTYVTDSPPDLPSANVSTDYPTPQIDPKLIEIRNAEAKRDVERIARSRRQG